MAELAAKKLDLPPMAQKKLQRFAELKAMPNAMEYPANMQGKWHSYFGNHHTITLELACGKGEYAVGLAKHFTDQNFIGVDLKGNRMWVGAKQALQQNLSNVAFLRSQIEKIDDYFLPGEIADIWITFPDPQLSLSRAKKRLTHPRFLRLYQKILRNNGSVHLKTDSPDLYNFTKTVINLFRLVMLNDVNDVYALVALPYELGLKTHYEKLDIAKSNKIFYLQFQLQGALPEEKDEQLKKIISEEAIG